MKEKERDTPLHDELRQTLLEPRQKAKLTQRQLADRLGWNHKVISNLERGSKRLTVIELVQIARALDFDAASVVRRIERKGMASGGSE